MMTSAGSGRTLWLLTSLLLTSLLSSVQADVPLSTFVVPGSGDNNVTVSINVPSTNTNDDLYWRFTAPAGQSWAAFGFGSGMSGSLIFVTYASEDGKNVTVSPRYGLGHVMPSYTKDVQVDVLSGSGIIDDTFVVNARCQNCRSWNGNSVNVKSTSQGMIWAVGPSHIVLESNDVGSAIGQHDLDDMGTVQVNMVAATGTGGVPSSSNSNAQSVSADGAPGFSTPGVGFHALLMVVSFLVLFPLGYLLLRVFDNVKVHMGIQSITVLVVIVGSITGIVISRKHDLNPNLTDPHQIIGLVVLGLVLISWGLGFSGHMIYKKTKVPAKPMKVHRIIGPLTIALGLVNATLGFRFAGNYHPIIGFVVVTLLMIIFVSTLVFLKRRSQRRKAAFTTPAAQNFRQGMQDGMPPAYSNGAYGKGPQQGDVPLQEYYAPPQGPPPQQQQQEQKYEAYVSDEVHDEEQPHLRTGSR